MTVQEAANELGVNPKVVYYAIATNKIKPKKRGDLYWITPAMLKKLTT
jgi:hypothetical protein